MKQKKRILLIVLTAIALVLLFLIIWQWENIGGLISKLDYGEASVQPVETGNSAAPTETELKNPDTTQNQMLPPMQETTLPTQPSEGNTSAPDESTFTEPETTIPVSTEPVTQPTQPATENPQEQRINELIAMVYALKDEYISRLNAIEQAGIAEYNALPPEEQTQERKEEIALKCVDEAYALEKECDGKIDEICTELGYLLIQTDGDLSLINEIRYVYASEKTAAKNELTERYGALLG